MVKSGSPGTAFIESSKQMISPTSINEESVNTTFAPVVTSVVTVTPFIIVALPPILDALETNNLFPYCRKLYA